ncbi:MAG: FG-GAP repeat domain-containing protein [Terriglobales bacterium]
MAGQLITSTLFALLSLTQFAAGEVAFKAVQTYPVGSDPRFMAAGDFNRDGKMDLAVLNMVDATISILLGNGDGTFQPTTTLAADTNAQAIAGTDLNGDQRLDLIITGDSGVSVLLGNGDGTFQTPLHFDGGVSLGYNGLVVADFNVDGKPDLAVTNANGVSILLGNGDGTFQSRIDDAVGTAPSGTTMVVGDFNGDKRPDVAVVGSAGLVILLGNGDGTFQSPLSQNGFPFVRAVADFDKDGKLDLLVDNEIVRCGSGGIYFCEAPVGVMLGNGDGTFQAPSIINAKSLTLSALTADFDGDGNADIGVVEGGGDMAIYLGDGKGAFVLVKRFPLVVPGGYGLVVSAVAADFTGDKAPDIAGPNAGAADAAVLTNNTGSDFSIAASQATPGAIGPGQSATSTLKLTLLNAFETPVSLVCAVQPTQPGAPTCSFGSSSVTFDANGEASATLTLSAGTSAASLNSLQPFGTGSLLWLPVVGFVFVGTGFSMSSSRRRRRILMLPRRRILMLPIGAILLTGTILQIACGGGGGSSSGPKSTGYTVTITGTSGATQHSTTVNLTVQ